MDKELATGKGPRVIQEHMSTRAIEALMSNYRDAQQAFLELVDNAIDNRIENSPLAVRIRIAKNELIVANQGGQGLDFAGLEKFFVWGYSEKTTGKTIGFYGVGGKAAMGYLGRSMEVVCSPKDSFAEYRVSDPSWETREEGEWKKFDAEERRASSSDGYFRVRVWNVKKEVNSMALSQRLAEIYRPLLLDRSVTIFVNGKKIEPLEIKYVEDDVNLKPEHLRINTRFGDPINLKVGILAEGQSVKPGIRCYYRGRLMEDEEFFDHPSPAIMPQAARLTGEAHLDFVPVMTNKANFMRDSAQWKNAEKRVHDFLSPWYEKLATLKTEHSTPVENFEKELARKAKRVIEHIFATSGIVVKGMLPGESSGRRPGTPREVVEHKSPTGRPGGPGPKEGQTAPHMTATIGEMKRWGALSSWEPAPMGESGRRSDVVEKDGRQILKINTDHPLYQAEKKAGDDALELYIAETAILKIGEIVSVGKSIEDYSELVNNLSRQLGAIYRGRIREKTPRKKK